MITQNITEVEFNFLLKLRDNISNIIDIFVIKENELNVDTNIKEMKFIFEGFRDIKKDSNINNIDGFIKFFVNDFFNFLMNKIANNNAYKEILTTNEKNIIIDFMINHYANDLFFQNILSCEIYNNSKANSVYEIKNYICLKQSNQYNFLTNKIIQLSEYKNKNNNTLFLNDFINIFKYIDENNFNDYFFKIKNKIIFDNIKNESLKKNILLKIVNKIDVKNNINLFNTMNKYLMDNNILDCDLFNTTIYNLDVNPNLFIDLIISDNWLKFEKYILNLNEKNNSPSFIYLHFLLDKINDSNHINKNSCFKFYDNLITKQYFYKNDNDEMNLIIQLSSLFEYSFKNKKNINQLLNQYLNKYFINENVNIISPIMIFDLIGNNAKFYKDKVIKYISKDYFSEEMIEYVKNSFIDVKLSNLNHHYNQLIIDTANLFINYSDIVIDVINAVLLYKYISDENTFTIYDDTINKNNIFYKKNYSKINMIDYSDIKLDDFIKIINQNNLNENSKLILKNLYEYLSEEMNFIHYKHRNNFISLFLQNIHFNFITINDSLNEELKKIDFSKKFLKNYINLIKIDEYEKSIKNNLNNVILNSDKVMQDKCEIIKNNIQELYQVNKNKKTIPKI